jgi:hypothetical protein
MKKLFCLVTITIVSLSFSQQKETQLQITLLEKSKTPLSKKTHNHTYNLINSTDRAIEYTIHTNQIDCKNNSSKMSVNVHSLTGEKLSKVFINANASQTFTVVMQQNHLTKLDTWSCVEISAINQQGSSISNTLVLSQFTPDINNFK